MLRGCNLTTREHIIELNWLIREIFCSVELLLTCVQQGWIRNLSVIMAGVCFHTNTLWTAWHGISLSLQTASLEICSVLSDIHTLYCERTGKACHSSSPKLTLKPCGVWVKAKCIKNAMVKLLLAQLGLGFNFVHVESNSGSISSSAHSPSCRVVSFPRTYLI